MTDFAVVSMSEAAADGDDDGYLRWHLLDHLPEQYGIAGVRHGERWRAVPGAERIAAPPYDRVEHVVMYLFAAAAEASLDSALDEFFSFGAELNSAGRMPVSLPRVQVGGWAVGEQLTAPHALVRAEVLPWRPHRGVFVIIETGEAQHDLATLVEVSGVAGAWRFRRDGERHRRLPAAEGDSMTVCFVDGDPAAVAAAMTSLVDPDGVLLAAPFQLATLPS